MIMYSLCCVLRMDIVSLFGEIHNSGGHVFHPCSSSAVVGLDVSNPLAFAVCRFGLDIQYPIVVLAKLQGGEMVRWKSLDGVGGLVGDKPGYAAFMRDEVNKMLGRTGPQPPADGPNIEPSVQ